MTRILLTNDDGILATGIAVLRRALEGLGDVQTIAPDRNTSAVARGITIHRALHLQSSRFGEGWEGTALDGTPSDCVRVGLLGVLGPPPDLVVSGVNLGGNMGADVAYSGTVGAALEAVLRGVPGVAVSIEPTEPRWLDEAVPVIRAIVRQTIEHGLPPSTALNVNLPDLPLAELGQLKVTRLGGASCHDRILLSADGDGSAVTEYPIRWTQEPVDHWAGTDREAVEAGHVSLTPLTYDLVAETALQLLASWDLDMDVLRS
jgi:5'-nucleotidase